MLNEGTAGAAPVVAPRKAVYAVTEKGDRSFWTRVGVAFVNRDGSITVRLDAMPVSGVLNIRDDEPRRNGGAG